MGRACYIHTSRALCVIFSQAWMCGFGIRAEATERKEGIGFENVYTKCHGVLWNDWKKFDKVSRSEMGFGGVWVVYRFC